MLVEADSKTLRHTPGRGVRRALKALNQDEDKLVSER